MLDWGVGSYETTAGPDLEPVSEHVVAVARINVGDRVVDLACGSGNAALLAAEHSANVVGIDLSARLVEVAAARAHSRGVGADFRVGDLSSLPAETSSADVVISVFGLIFAPDPARALGEVRRILDPSGRVLITAWQPRGPIMEMIAAIGQIAAPPDAPTPPRPFAWHDPAVLGPAATAAGLTLTHTDVSEVAFRAASPAAYVDTNAQHPMYAALQPRFAAAGAERVARETQIRVLSAANEDPDAFLVHSPYVLHTLAPASVSD